MSNDHSPLVYNYYPMSLKRDMAQSNYISGTGFATYYGWKKQLPETNSGNWWLFRRQFNEAFQFAMLRGMTVIGVGCEDWGSLFIEVLGEYSPFKGVVKAYTQGNLKANWPFFAQKIAKETSTSIHYPAIYPEWLVPYGYNQKMYLQDLPVYWDNIHEDYYKPWKTTPIREDSPEVVRVRRLGEVARQEIDEVGRHSQKYLKR